MSHVQELKEIWESDKAQDLGVMVRNALDLLILAQQNQEDIPLDLEIDVLLAANYSFGYGSTLDESSRLIRTFKRLQEQEDTKHNPKIHRFVCTVISSILSLMTSDEQQDSKMVNQALSSLGITSSDNRSTIIQSLFHREEKHIDYSTITMWNLELIGYLITLFSMLEVSNSVSDREQEVMKNLSKLFSRSLDTNEQRTVDKWKSEWLEKSDYFRFVSLMIYGSHSPEDLWIENAEKYTGLSFH